MPTWLIHQSPIVWSRKKNDMQHRIKTFFWLPSYVDGIFSHTITLWFHRTNVLDHQRLLCICVHTMPLWYSRSGIIGYQTMHYNYNSTNNDSSSHMKVLVFKWTVREWRKRMENSILRIGRYTASFNVYYFRFTTCWWKNELNMQHYSTVI